MTDLATVPTPPTDLTEPNRSWGARDRQQWLTENLFITGEWSTLTDEQRANMRKEHQRFYDLKETAMRQDFKVASMLSDHLSDDYEVPIRIHQSRLDRESVTAAEPKDRIAAIKAFLQSAGALNPKARQEDTSQLNDKQFEHRMVQAIARPDKAMRVFLRKAFANPGPHLAELLNEWLQNSSTTTGGEEA